MSTFASFLPIDRRLALSKGETLPTRAWGTALIADVSGFTPLTAAYVEAFGVRQGAEKLIAQINCVYQPLIEQVHRFGGSVIYFSGDAITCYFDSDAGVRAVACALAMQHRMQTIDVVAAPGQHSEALTIKVAIAAGNVRRFALGDPDIMRIDALVGDTLTRMATAETLANPQEIVVSEEVVNPAANYQVQEWRSSADGHQRFAVITDLTLTVHTQQHNNDVGSEIPEAIIRTWLFDSVYERIKAGAEQYLSELRPVVALFIRFGGLDYDRDDAVGEKLDRYIRWVQHTVARYEGFLLQLTSGDKGSYLYAAFGAPVAHENDADRALLAAQTLRRPPGELDFIKDVQIGISRGLMRVGAIGSQTRRAYGACGHETNMAARLMTAASPGEIVVSRHVVEAMIRPGLFALESIGKLNVKGNPKAIHAYHLMPQTTAPVSSAYTQHQRTRTEPSILIGREEEQQKMYASLSKLQAGESGLLLIEGEAGIGKSYIVEAFLDQAKKSAVISLLGEANAIEQASPYFVWRAIFRSLFGLDETALSAEERQARVLQQLPEDAALRELAPLLNSVLEVDLPENELTQEMSGLGRANKTHELLTAVLHHIVAQRPLLIILEDAHWLDSASWALAEAITQQVAPLLLVFVMRPLAAEAVSEGQNGSASEFSPLLTAGTTERIRLRRLSVAESLQLVCQRLRVKSLPTPIANFIQKRAEGHPFFSEELGYALREAGVIDVTNGSCRLTIDATELEKLNFPTTIEGVITSRIDRLAPSQQLTLKVSSVIGRIFAITILHDIHPAQVQKEALVHSLQDLDRLDITLLETPEPELAYIFRHIITQQVAYNLLLFVQRRELHNKVATWYEQQYADSLDSVVPLLAYHWYQALELDFPDPALAQKAIAYAERAGDQAIRKYANQEAVRFFTDAQSIAEKLTDETIVPQQRWARWALQLGEAHIGLGQLNEAREHYERCLMLLGWPVKPPGGRMILGMLGDVVRRGLPKRPSQTNSDQRSALQQAARAFEMLGQIYYLTNQPVPTLFAMLRGLTLAERVGEGTPELARAYANMSGAVALVPLHKQSRSFEARAWETVRPLNNKTSLTYVAFITSVHKINTANWKSAISGFTQGLELATQLGDRRTAGFCISGLGHIAFYRGYMVKSLELFQQLAALGEAAQDVTHWATGIGGIGAVKLHQGEWETAQFYFEQALPLALEAGNTLAEWNCRARLALVDFWLGGRHQAKELILANVAYALDAPLTSFANTTVYSELITLLLLLRQNGEEAPLLRAQTERLLNRYRRYAHVFPFARPTYFRLLGMHAGQDGRSTAAVKAWRNTIATAEKKDIPYERGLGHLEIGRHLPADDPDRRHHLERSIQILTEIDAVFAVSQAETALQ